MRLRKVVVRTLAVIGAISLAVVVAVLVAAFSAGPTVPDRVLLTLDFRAGIPEFVPQNPVARLVNRDRASVFELLSALQRAATDPRVVGLLARVDDAPMGLAQIQEFRDAVSRFADAGKPSVAFAETIGGLLPGNGAYYLATSFEQIVVQPSGDVGLVGLSAEIPFLKDALGKLGIEPLFSKREAYKTAPNLFTESGFTEAHKEEMEHRLRARFEQLVGGIADARGLSADSVRKLADRGPYTAAEARDLGLVDRAAYADEVLASLASDAGIERLSLGAYAARTTGTAGTREDGVALIYGVGSILSGPSRYDPVTGDATVGSDTVVDAFRKSVEDARVRSIVLRIDSGGGSFVASDAIWRAARTAEKAGKPVVVSMGNLAASGAYLASTHARRIIAQPGTLTGSIGVFAGKFVTRELWTKLGVTWEALETGERARVASSLQAFSPDQQAAFERQLDRVYDTFLARVSEGRSLSADATRRLAGGRVWLGSDALDVGLVDELGGISRAVDVAREIAGLPADAPVRVFPKERSIVELLLDEGLEGTSVRLSASVVMRLQNALRPLAWLLEAAAGTDQRVAIPFARPDVR